MIAAAGADLDPRLMPVSEQAFDLAGIDIVVSTHLHFDHSGCRSVIPVSTSTCASGWSMTYT